MPVTGEPVDCVKGYKRFYKRRCNLMKFAYVTYKSKDQWVQSVLTEGGRECEGNYYRIKDYMGY